MKRFRTLSSRRVGLCLMLVALVILTAAILSGSHPAQAAQQYEQVIERSYPAPSPSLDNAACLACHGAPDKILTFANGDTLSISMDPAVFDSSVHSQIACVNCHTQFTGYPHPANTATTVRDYKLNYQSTCKTCHPDQFAQVQDSMHTKLFLEGNKNAPFCVDCHNPHSQTQIRDDQGKLLPQYIAKIPDTCARCHSAIFNEYAQSIHGSAILEENNPDTPTCTYCHGVHTINDPTTAAFRNSSINLCASCHTDEKLMSKYNLSTQVLNTYVSDFHGTTVTIFQHQSPNEMTNKPVCYDCHGIHNISKLDDPQKGLQIKDNLRRTCEKCHPGININFPDSWLSHYIPSTSHYALVYFVQLFYKILIPTVIGGMLVFVLSDAYRRIFRRGKVRAETPATPDAKE
jgi:predicted CXXCH cytochrome family protein